MKAQLPITFKVSVLFFFLFSASSYAQNTYVPDDNFEQRLIALGYDTYPLDDYVPTANISGITILNIINQNISDLTGIEDFAALTDLLCYTNNLTSLDVSNNTALTQLFCNSNNLTSLDVSANTALITLNCKSNNLTSLNVKNGNNTNISNFFADDNPNLTCIQVDDAAWSTANWTNIDPQSYFSEDCGALSLEDLSLQNISIYPNPTQNTFSVKGLKEDSQLEVYNLNGVLVLKQQNYKGKIVDVSNLSSSIYFIKISNSNGTGVKRLVVE
jgi:Secretion system C-terminal sorting domain